MTNNQPKRNTRPVSVSVGVPSSQSLAGRVVMNWGHAMTTAERRHMLAYERVRRSLFPDEQPRQDRAETRYRAPERGRAPCGGGYRRLLVAGIASE